jgi:hypothetical protein
MARISPDTQSSRVVDLLRSLKGAFSLKQSPKSVVQVLLGEMVAAKSASVDETVDSGLVWKWVVLHEIVVEVFRHDDVLARS